MKKHFKRTRLSELGEITRGVTYKSPDDLRPAGSPRTVQLLRATNIQDGAITLDDVQVIDEACAPDRQRLATGDIAICIANGSRALVGKAALVDIAEPDGYVVGAFCARFRPRQGESSDLIAAIFESQEYRSWIDRLLGTTTINNLKPSDIADCPIMLPTEESGRRRLGAVMRTSRNAIRHADALIAAKREQKRGLMQQLLTGKVRFPGFTEPWKTVRLGDIAARVTRRNNGASTRVLTASGQHGLIDQREFFSRRVASAKIDVYFLLKRGEFAYNRSAMQGYEFGAIKRLERYDEAAISTLYVCFGLTSAEIDSDFLAQLFDSRVLDSQLRTVVRIGIRDHGLLNLDLADFFEMSVRLPGQAEQQQIARVLTRMDNELRLLLESRAAFSSQRRGLMERLLSGEIDIPSSDTSAA